MGTDNVGGGCDLRIVVEFVALAILLLASDTGAAMIVSNAWD